MVLPVSKASYGMYLMHMLILPHWFRFFDPLMCAALTVPATAIATYLSCFVISHLVGKLPFGKYIVG